MTKPANITRTTAQEIVDNAIDSADAMEFADVICEGDQDWESETTTWTFSYGSRLGVCGSEYSAH